MRVLRGAIRTAAPFTGARAELRPTYDNRATTDELRFLARAFHATNDESYRDAFLRGLDYVLDGQYPNGGWPQSSPPGDGYPRHITFNDNTMVRLLEFVREVARDDRYAFVDGDRRGPPAPPSRRRGSGSSRRKTAPVPAASAARWCPTPRRRRSGRGSTRSARTSRSCSIATASAGPASRT
jgi:hypothetical protein